MGFQYLPVPWLGGPTPGTSDPPVVDQATHYYVPVFLLLDWELLEVVCALFTWIP